MSVPDRSQMSDLRGAARMLFDAAAVTAEVVERMHRTIQQRPFPLSHAAREDRTRGLTGFVYRNVRGGIRLLGQAVDTGLGSVEASLPASNRLNVPDAHRSVLNGIYGDYLTRTDNPLAIEMSLNHRGLPVDAHDLAGLFLQHNALAPSKRLLLLVHGLCMNDRHWHRDGHDHGAMLADEAGYLPLYLRYNSGLPVANNGRVLADLLESLIGDGKTPVEEMTIIGHSMGGLVARSASHHAKISGHRWPKYLRALVFLGTPHHGAPLERGGHFVDRMMQSSPYSLPVTRLSKARSAGIMDLRHGTVSVDDENVPLPSAVACFTAAAARTKKRDSPGGQWLGDGLVPVNSALGQHRDASRTLAIPKSHQWIGYGMGHYDLLNHPDLSRQLLAWLR